MDQKEEKAHGPEVQCPQPKSSAWDTVAIIKIMQEALSFSVSADATVIKRTKGWYEVEKNVQRKKCMCKTHAQPD